MAIAINPALLVAAPILQDYFSDNATDAAMSNGVITCFQDNSRTTLKNWYYQTGSPGAYTYTQLNNPLTLSAAGTITDPNGNDTIPFWYPFSELDNVSPQPYYVTVVNSNGQMQFTRQNFPFVPPANTSNTTPTLSNLLVNNVFWRNGGTQALTFSSVTPTYSLNGNTLFYQKLCPSQHDGFGINTSDITFVKNQFGATDVATFTQFNNATNRLTGDATPEFYLNMSCGNSGTSETIKYIQIPICLHVDNLSGFNNASVSIWTQNATGAANGQITLTLFPFLGTGNTSPVNSPIATITPSTTWQKSVFTFNFNTPTLPVSPGDDAWFLQIGLPVGVTYNINIAKPSIYLSETVPSNDFQTYEVASSMIDSARTGDIRTSVNTYQPYGWVPMNNGTIGNASSNATSRKNNDTWPLFQLLWTQFSVYNSGTTNILAQMVNSAGSNVAYGASAIADFAANNAITLTPTMGNVILGTAPVSTLLTPYSTTFTGSNSGGKLLLTAANVVNYFVGMPFYVTGGSIPDALSLNTIYYVTNFTIGTNTFEVATTFANAIAVNAINYGSTNGSGTVVGALAGSFEGEYNHSMSLLELPTHHHSVTPIGDINTLGNNHITMLANSDNQTSTTFNTANTGSGNSFNITQPGAFMNLFMKL